jgi:hypothetical protein
VIWALATVVGRNDEDKSNAIKSIGLLVKLGMVVRILFVRINSYMYTRGE